MKAKSMRPLIGVLFLMVSCSCFANGDKETHGGRPSYTLTSLYAPPFAIAPEEEGGQLPGFIYELVKMAIDEMGIDLEPSFYPLARVIKKFRENRGEMYIVAPSLVPMSAAEINTHWACAKPLFYVPIYLYQNRARFDVVQGQQGFDALKGHSVLIAEPRLISMRGVLPDNVELKVVSEPNKLAKMFWYERADALVSAGYIVDNSLADKPLDFEVSRQLLHHLPIEFCVHRKLANAESLASQFSGIWQRFYRSRKQEPVRSLLKKYQIEERWLLDIKSP